MTPDQSMPLVALCVSDALLEVGGEEFEGTAKFCEMMDKFFDALNVLNVSQT